MKNVIVASEEKSKAFAAVKSAAAKYLKVSANAADRLRELIITSANIADDYGKAFAIDTNKRVFKSFDGIYAVGTLKNLSAAVNAVAKFDAEKRTVFVECLADGKDLLVSVNTIYAAVRAAKKAETADVPAAVMQAVTSQKIKAVNTAAAVPSGIVAETAETETAETAETETADMTAGERLRLYARCLYILESETNISPALLKKVMQAVELSGNKIPTL